MKNQRGFIKLSAIILIVILLIVLIIGFNTYKKNYFNNFEKATTDPQKITNFTRDSEIKYSKSDSYKIENVDFNDATFYKEIEVEKNTPYKISCMVKTENVVCELEDENGGVSIGLLNTTEYSAPITGTNDWQYVEYMFNSRNREKVIISFRLGGNQNKCTGTAWFSDFKIEKGIATSDYEWNIGCFIINELDVNIEGKRHHYNINSEDIKNVELNIERYKQDCYEFSEKRMQVNYEIIEVDTPITTISYSDEHGYFLADIDVRNAIYETVKQKEFDHIFVVCRMEDEEGNSSIPIKDNWIGLGSMDIYGVGYSLVRINKNSNEYTYKFGITNQAPEEVYVHEFCHTIERNLKEYGYDVPALHDYEKYGYTEITVEGLNEWYEDYMSKEVYDENTGTYIGLDEFGYMTQPPNSSNFKYPIEIEFIKEPQNIFEEILTVFDVLTK